MNAQSKFEQRNVVNNARKRMCSGAVLAGVLSAGLAGANDARSDSWVDALGKGKLTIDSRLRSETVDDEAFSPQAHALTWRNRLGYKTTPINGFGVYFELENTQALDESYNSTANGRSRYPVVADPEGSEWNQAGIAWDSEKRDDGSATHVVLGRQRINLDNQRFIGSVGWRQNEQSFDAFSLSHSLSATSTLRYIYVDEVHRVFGHNHPNPLAAGFDLHGHLLNASHVFALGTVTGYGYWIENLDQPQSSTQTLGARFSGAKSLIEPYKVLYSAEYARQDDWRKGAANIGAHYQLLELGLARGGYSAKLAQEVLSSNRSSAFQTPFATLHAFNGWADKFLSTPTAGLVDEFITLSGPLGKAQWQSAYHHFSADKRASPMASKTYGKEWDASVSYAFNANFTGLVKLARYQGSTEAIGSLANDTDKLWLSIEYHY